MLHELRLKNIDDEIVKSLKSRAAEKGIDINTYAISLLKRVLGLEKKENYDNVYHDLDYLAGTWTKEDAEIFAVATEDFNKIDEELWK